MYKSVRETKAFFTQLAPPVAGAEHADVMVCPPCVNVAIPVESAKSTIIEIGAQDVSWVKEGA
jgi:triosephosphate isomerase